MDKSVLGFLSLTLSKYSAPLFLQSKRLTIGEIKIDGELFSNDLNSYSNKLNQFLYYNNNTIINFNGKIVFFCDKLKSINNASGLKLLLDGDLHMQSNYLIKKINNINF